MSTALLPPSSLLPTELVPAIARDAADDAQRVADFLDALGRRPTGEGADRAPLRLPCYVLVFLAAALRLWVWEQGGLFAHRDAGLPSADEAVRDLSQALLAPDALADKEMAARRLLRRVLCVFAARLAWGGRALLGADLELGEAEEDALVDALADFLWANRRHGAGPVPTE